MKRRIEVLLLLAVASACDTDDVGQPCPQLTTSIVSESQGGRLETDATIEQNAAFPCEDLVCAATDGQPAYCTRSCESTSGCPEAFDCTEVQPVGPFAGRKFCTWKACNSDEDCGNNDDYCCADVGDGPQGIKVCALITSGSC